MRAPPPQVTAHEAGRTLAVDGRPGAGHVGGPFQEARPMPQLLPVPEIIRRLRLHSKPRGNIKAIAGMGEIDYYHLRQIAREGKMSVRMQTLLSDILGRSLGQCASTSRPSGGFRAIQRHRSSD
jgi:hypothetical protein